MTTIGIIGDIHLSTTPPGRRDEHYLTDVQAKLDEVASHATGIDAWVLIGDVFHRKNAAHNPPSLVLWLWGWLDRLSAHGAEVVIVPGNHDLADGSIQSLDRQPLAILGHHPAVTLATGTHHPFGPVPGDLPEHTTYMAVPGAGSVCDAAEDPAVLFTHDVDLVFAHAPIDPTTRPWATYDPVNIELAERTRAIIYGHQHDQPRSWHRPDGKLVVATGAISRGSVTEAGHEPAWVKLTTSPVATEARVIPIRNVRPAAEVFRWAERAAEQADAQAITDFAAALGSHQLVGLSREGLMDDIARRQDVPAKVTARAVAILSDL